MMTSFYFIHPMPASVPKSFVSLAYDIRNCSPTAHCKILTCHVHVRTIVPHNSRASEQIIGSSSAHSALVQSHYRIVHFAIYLLA